MSKGHHETDCLCPHCDAEQGDAWEMDDGDHECGSCGEMFELSTDRVVSVLGRIEFGVVS